MIPRIQAPFLSIIRKAFGPSSVHGVNRSGRRHRLNGKGNDDVPALLFNGKLFPIGDLDELQRQWNFLWAPGPFSMAPAFQDSRYLQSAWDGDSSVTGVNPAHLPSIILNQDSISPEP